MSRMIRVILGFLIGACLATPVLAASGKVEVLWLGHATTRITSVEGKVIVIDPFLKKNPKTPKAYKDLKALGKVDLILVTHGHGDHVKDLKELAAMTGATVVATWEFMSNLTALGLTEASRTIGMNKGGTITPLGRGIKVHMVPAEHSSSVDLLALGLHDSDSQSPRMVEGGSPVGYVIELESGYTIYHSGDTGVFGDMALIHEFYQPDLAMVSIGGHFTMDPKGAAFALTKYLKPKQVIPIHFGTYPVINRTPDELKRALGKSEIEMLDVKPGEKLTF